jgi:predicted nuclease of predicted toxin-antitoxin system
VFPSLVADMNIAVEVIAFLRARGVDVVSAREQAWGDLTDSEILAHAHAQSRFVMTHDSDFATLAVHRGEPFTGILYLRPGGQPPAEVIVDIEVLLDAEIDWRPPVLAVYRAGRLRLRRQ